MRNALIRIAILLPLVVAAVQPAGCEPSPREETDALDYNVTFRAATRDPVRLLFASPGKGSGYLLEVTGRRASLARLDGGKATPLASGSLPRGDGARAFTVKRRQGILSVECDRRPLLSTRDDRYAAGAASFTALPAGTSEDLDFRLQPVGEVECGDDFLPDSSVASGWEAVSGKWAVDSYRDPMMGEDQGPVGASWLAARGDGACAFVGGEEFWEDLSLQVTTRLAKGSTAGILFNYRDAGNYGRFRIEEGRPGLAILEEVVDGKLRRVAKAAWYGDLKWWRRLRIETSGTFVRALTDDLVAVRGTLSTHTDGRVGLFADGGTEALFDDLAVRSCSLLHESLARADLREWTRTGSWQATASSLRARPASRALASPTASTWSGFSASLLVDPAAGTEAGLLFRAGSTGSGYALTLRRGSGEARWLLKRVDGPKAEVLASAPAKDRPGWRRLAVRAVGGKLQAYGDDEPLPAAYDFTYPEGSVSLLADGNEPASFSRLEVVGPVADRTAPLLATDFAEARVRGLYKPAGQFEFLRPLGDLLAPASPAWIHDVKEGVLKARGSGALWYWDAWEGDLGVACSLDGVPASGSAGLLLCGDGRDPESGYRLALDGKGALVLHRKGKPVARAALRPPHTPPTLGGPGGADPTRLSLRRDGMFVVGSAGNARLAFRETDPVEGSRVGLWSGCAGPVLDDASVWLVNATNTPFDRVDTDWRPASGEWLLHSGMTCVPWTYWLAADGRKEPALMWYRHPLPRDFELLFRVSEHSEGNEEGEHRHFPYHDIRLVLCGSPEDPSAGYTLLLGADGGKTNRLLRGGKVVAENRRLTIEMGGHCNEPRQIHLRVRRQGGTLHFRANGVPLFEYTDPEPPAGGQVALGLSGCRANFRDFILSASRTWLPGGDWSAAVAAK